MRRTITTLMFLAAGGLTFAAHAAEQSRGSSNWQYYAAGEQSYRVSDDDDSDEAEAAPAASQAAAEKPVSAAAPAETALSAAAPVEKVVQAVAPAELPVSKPAVRPEKNALYVPELSGTVGTGIAPTNYLGAGVGGCGCSNSACGCGQNSCGGGCGGNCGSSLADCYCDCSRTTFRFEYLLWFSRGRNTPPLVTTSEPFTSQADAGILGLPSTNVDYGNDRIGTDIRNGGRVSLSHLFSDGITYGDVRFWGVEDSSETFATTSANNPIIGRPFFNVGLGIDDAFLVAFPGLTDPGEIRVLSKNDLIGADAYLRRNLWDDCDGSLDILGGYQFTRLDDSLVISNTSVSAGAGAGVPIGTTISLFDSFRTQNEFHAASAGILARSYRNAITLELLAKIAVGNMRQRVIVDGSNTTTTPGGGTSVTTGGLLALPTNIGERERNRAAISPELNINAVYDIDDAWRVFGGYSFIYWSSVVLAGNQIDPALNLTQIPGPIQGPALPSSRIQRSDFWVQGVNFGAEYRW